MATKEYQEAVSELLDILDNTDEELIKKIPPELILFWEQNKSEEYVPDLDHNISLEEMKLKTKTRQLIAMIYINYLCDSEKRKDIKKMLKEAEEREKKQEEKEGFSDNIKSFNQRLQESNEEEEKIKEDIYMIEKEKFSFFTNIINKIKKFF